jgi:thioredoxin 1
MATVAITADTFDEVLAANDIVLLDFWAEWCGPCRTFGPIFEQVSENHPDITFGKVDTEAEQALAAQFRIMSIPTLMILRDKIVLFAQPGVVPREGLEDLITQVRNLDMDEVRKAVAEQATTAS